MLFEGLECINLFMRLFRHYKNHDYRYIGTVRHSETLEEMALYDCLYPNDLGKTWVRPLDMFHGETLVDGKSVPRFAPVSLTIKESNQITSSEVETLKILCSEIFAMTSQLDPSVFSDQKRNSLLLLAEVDGKPVGFNFGYLLEDKTFEIFLCGVLPAFQKLGIASALMNRLLEWCRSQGIKKIRTATDSRFSSMLIFNIKSGFQIVDFKITGDDRNVVMEKHV